MIESISIDMLINQGVLVAFFVYAIREWDKLTKKNIEMLEKVALTLERNEKILRKIEERVEK